MYNKHKKTKTKMPKYGTSRILVVDDNHNNLEFSSLLLKKLGFNCNLAESGEKALKLLKEVDYDLIFLDLQMPSMSGFEVTRKIREKQLKKGQNPAVIVAMTAGDVIEEKNRALQAGMDAFIPKPVDLKDVKIILDKYVPPEKHPYSQNSKLEDEGNLNSYLYNIPTKKLPMKIGKKAKSWGGEEVRRIDPNLALVMKILEKKNVQAADAWSNTVLTIIVTLLVAFAAVLLTYIFTSRADE